MSNKGNNNNNNNKNKNQVIRKVRPNSYRYIRNRNPAPRINRNAVNQMINNYRLGIKQYLRGLMFPEDAISGSYVCKQPSYIGLPTSNVVFKEQLNFVVGTNKKFGLIWVPNYLSTQPSLEFHNIKNFGSVRLAGKKQFYSHLYFTTELEQTNKWKLHSSFLPAIDLSKYRLVSSKISVQYNGTVMNQSGQLHSCVIYDDLPVFSGYCGQTVENLEFDMSDHLSAIGIPSLNSYLDIEKMRNGLWPKYVNITNNTGQIDNIALPSDPTDHTFFPLTHYYAIEPEGVYQEETFGVASAISSDGGHLSYVYLGDGLPQNANITVVVYYNFEIIATQATATFLRGRKDDDKRGVKQFINEKQDVIIEEVSKYASENNNLTAPGTGGQISNNVVRFINTLTNILAGALTGNYANIFKAMGPKSGALNNFKDYF